MTDERDPPDDDEEIPDAVDMTPEDVYEAMEPFEPYTTGELASVLEIPKRIARRFLNALTTDERIRKKEPEAERVIWIREPSKHECPECGREFEVKYFHPIFQAAQFCPRCGTQL